MLDLKINEKGFVLIEFIIALPLIILLLYGLAQSTLMMFKAAKEQAADYVLEVEAQDILSRITQDLRAASKVEITPRFHQADIDIDTLTIKYHAIKYDAGKIIDIIDTRVYKVSDQYKLNAKRQDDKIYLNPINGGNFFGDTIIRKLKYSFLDKRVMHITLEMQSVSTIDTFGTNRRIKVSTAVFMPACENYE